MNIRTEPTTREFRDVCEQLVLAGLREQQARLDAEQLADERGAVLAQLTDGVVTVDSAGRVVFVNAAARQIDDAFRPGLSLASPGTSKSVRAPDGRPYPAASHPIGRALRGETVIGVEARLIRSDSTEIMVQISATPLSAEDGQILGAVVTLRDSAGDHELADRNVTPDFISGDIAIKFRLQQVTLRGLPVALTPIEYRLLVLLISNAGWVLPAQTILDHIWEYDADAKKGYLKVYIHRLRLKIEPMGSPRCIETVRGVGYRFARPVALPANELSSARSIA